MSANDNLFYGSPDRQHTIGPLDLCVVPPSPSTTTTTGGAAAVVPPASAFIAESDAWQLSSLLSLSSSSPDNATMAVIKRSQHPDLWSEPVVDMTVVVSDAEEAAQHKPICVRYDIVVAGDEHESRGPFTRSISFNANTDGTLPTAFTTATAAEALGEYRPFVQLTTARVTIGTTLPYVQSVISPNPTDLLRFGHGHKESDAFHY